ncbi:MAG: hypothetical protein HRT87_09640 [Legionellales bacterium]|nr:hypothetical protein [Legionellales bacterium]
MNVCILVIGLIIGFNGISASLDEMEEGKSSSKSLVVQDLKKEDCG